MSVKKNNNKKKKDSVFSGNQVMMMLENITDSMSLLAEGHKTLENKMDKRFNKMDKRFDKMDKRFDKMDKRFDRMDKRFDKFEVETKTNFKAVFEYLSRIEDEIVSIKKELKNLQKNKAENSMVLELTERIVTIEADVAMLKKQKAV